MRRVITLGFVVGLLLVGAFLTTQASRGVPLFSPTDPLPPDASVFTFTPDQRLILLGIVVAVTGATFGMGVGLALAVRALDRAYRQAVSEEAPVAQALPYQEAEALGIHLPAPSLAPLIVGLGAALVAVGVIIFPLLIAGVVVLLLGIGAWAVSSE